MTTILTLPSGTEAPTGVAKKIDEFLKAFHPYELVKGGNVYIYLDEKSKAFYLTCHLEGEALAESCDSEASLGADEEDEIYKLNRDVQEDQAAYKLMEQDAQAGRSFEDIVLEYDTSYRAKRPFPMIY